MRKVESSDKDDSNKDPDSKDNKQNNLLGV